MPHPLPLTNSTDKPFLLDAGPDMLKAWLAERSQPPMRLQQIQHWINEGRAMAFEQMTNLPVALRQELDRSFAVFSSRIDRSLLASDGTEKLLLRLRDGNVIECVLLKEENRRTACISTQVGCAMGCVFCASGINGVVRNLSATEIIEQLLQVRNRLPSGERLSHVVVMGMGEPLANLYALLEALKRATSPRGLGLSARHITISTVGLPAQIRKLANLDVRYHLAVSLHAPNDNLRNQIVPTNQKVGLQAILEAADYFQEKTGRQVTYEYVLLEGINDQTSHAVELGRLLRGRKAHVNLIPFNRVAGLPFRRLSPEALADFVTTLKNHQVSVKVRKRKGADIDAACGQLRREALDQSAPCQASPEMAGNDSCGAVSIDQIVGEARQRGSDE
ncbi:MAG: 23S rRNA (adenine(2503)-C(2))-methyltransferase RlmN [Gemmataceae bacterium]